MIDPDVHNAIYQLHQQGMSLREISRRLHVSRNAVRKIVKQQGKFTRHKRSDKKQIDASLLERLYRECDGWMQRIHEKLVEEEGIQVGYSTLTRMLRELGLSRQQPRRCDRVADEPGAEMQHDTTVYQVRLADRRTKVIASLLYLRYSKRRYLKFYRVFNRFAMKCFLHEALMFWGYAARHCIIDNTNLARLRGVGSHAVIVPEMDAFSRARGFQFICHALDHPNRKAGNERSFWSVETGFLPGRTFTSLEDLNEQGRRWATERMEHRVLTKARVIPARLFEHERLYLNELPPHLPAPYQMHQRVTDQYGYVAFGANYYWVPGTRRDDVKVLQYAGCLKIFSHYECLAEYPLPPDGTRHQHYSPPGQGKPRHQPRGRRRHAKLEEQRLRALGDEVSAYLDFALSAPGVQRHRFTRELFALSRKLTSEVFRKTAHRAHRYRIVELATLRRIAWLCLSQEEEVLPEAEVDEDFRQRPAYQEGYLTDPPDLSQYDQLREEEKEEDEDGEPF
ncbi:MAG: helix-turn-helix domain-containing protein [Dehalococcoidia bacterium]